MRRFAGILSGFLGGLFGGLLGVGGGIIMIPLMTWLARLTQHQAHGTSLVAIVFTASVGAATYSMHGYVNWKASLLIAGSAIITARLGALSARALSEFRLKQAFGVFLCLISLLLFTKGFLPILHGGLSTWAETFIFLITGSFAGYVAGLMGVGGGAIMVPPMVLLCGMTQHLAQGTSLLAIVPTSISGAMAHYRMGNVKKDLVWGLAIGSLAGGYLGAMAARGVPEPYLRAVFSAMGLWMGIRYIGSGRKGNRSAK